MPYVDESSYTHEDEDYYFYFTNWGNPHYYLQGTWPNIKHDKAQYGWRSIGEKDASQADLLRVQKNAKWADTSKVISALDRVERALSNPLIRDRGDLICHARTYDVRDTYGQVGSEFRTYTEGGALWTVSRPIFSIAITNVSKMTDSEIDSSGAKLIRNSRPTSPHSNMGQWFGELRDSRRLLTADLAGQLVGGQRKFPKRKGKFNNNDFLRVQQELAGGYVNAHFGWFPFLGDFIKALQAIADSEKIVNQFLEDSGKLIRRTNRKIIHQNAVQGEFSIHGEKSSYGKYFVNHTEYGAYGEKAIFGFRQNNSNDLYADCRYNITTVTELRSSALFEYFAYDPQGALPRIQAAQQKAKLLLGDPLLSASTLWELLPWSWMADWFFDVGGLLSYQESVESDSLAARRASTVWETTTSATMDSQIRKGTSSGYLEGGKSTTIATRRYQNRRPGNPYGMGIDWSGFTPQRWFILGALGISNAPGISFG